MKDPIHEFLSPIIEVNKLNTDKAMPIVTVRHTITIDVNVSGMGEVYVWEKDVAMAIHAALTEALDIKPFINYPPGVRSGAGVRTMDTRTYGDQQVQLCSCGDFCRPGHCINVPA